jgi:hypothetical protein
VLAKLRELTYQFPRVLIVLLRVAVLTYPILPRPRTVLLKSVKVLAYPIEPRPPTVLNRLDEVTKPRPGRFAIVLIDEALSEATSVDSVELLAN